MLPSPLPAGTSGAELAAHFGSGDAFALVFDSGTLREQAALAAALAAGTALRWASVAWLRAVLYCCWRECAALGPAPTPPTHPAIAKLQARLGAARERAMRVWTTRSFR
jgi:hypothetical protein